MSINELGLRNAPVSKSVPTGRRRISVVGDSFVFAAALTEGEKFTDELQELVSPAVEIVNVSVPGYGTGQQLLLLELLAEQGYEIGDTVIAVVFTNDILDNVGMRYGSAAPHPVKPAFALRDGELVQVREPVDPFGGEERPFLEPTLLERSLFLSFLKKRFFLLASRMPGVVAALRELGLQAPLPRTPGIINGWYRGDWQERWLVTDALLAHLRDTVQRLGADRLLVAFLPSPFQVEPVFSEVMRGRSDPSYIAFLEDIERPQRALLETCARHALECVDLTGALREGGADGPAYFLREGHLNAHGSAIVARALHDALGDDAN